MYYLLPIRTFFACALVAAAMALVPTFSGLNSTRAEDQLVIANGEWSPLFSPDLPHYGLISRRVSTAMNAAGISVTYRFAPWSRGYHDSKTGIVDGAIGWPKSPERQRHHYYSSQPVEDGQWVLFHRRETLFSGIKPENLANLVFGVTIGDWALDGNDPLTMALESRQLNVSQANTDHQMFQMLANNRIDVFPQHVLVGRDQLQTLADTGLITANQRRNIIWHKSPYRRMPLYLLLSRTNPANRDIMARFDAAWASGAWKSN